MSNFTALHEFRKRNSEVARSLRDDRLPDNETIQAATQGAPPSPPLIFKLAPKQEVTERSSCSSATDYIEEKRE